MASKSVHIDPSKSATVSSVAVIDDTVDPPSYEATIASGLPHSDEIAAHLKLLFAVHKLRERVMNDSSCLGIRSDWLPVRGIQCTHEVQQIHKLIAEKRWVVFVQKAALRFELWWKALQKQSDETPYQIGNIAKGPFTVQQWTKLSKPLLIANRLPPLDVLMVWHTFILSPRKYLEDCLVQGMMGLWRTKFPWTEIDQAIDTDTGDFNPSPEAISAFEAIAPWSNTADPGLRKLNCPHCRLTMVQCPITDFDQCVERAERSYKERPDEGSTLFQTLQKDLKACKGWGDPAFASTCSCCHKVITADTLCASKFITHVKRYVSAYRFRATLDSDTINHLEDQLPMPGTVLDPVTGRPQMGPTSLSKKSLSTSRLFLLLLADTVGRVDSSGKDKEPKWDYSMAAVRFTLTHLLSSAQQMKHMTSDSQRRADKQQRRHVRRMMSYYNENPWMFSLDLASAVHRQGVFVQKMAHIDWLHSPALSSTARRVIVKYQRFITVMTVHPGDMAVPTLDVDLAWHTHQLTPIQYYKHTLTCTGRFIDHDDKVSEHKLSDSFAKTSKHYQRLFGETYSECSCWYCEAMHASVSRFGSHLLPGSTKMYRRPKNLHPVDDGTATAHISSHNVVRLENPPEPYKKQLSEHMAWLEKTYQRACDRAKKDGRPPPTRRHPPAAETDNKILYSVVAGGVVLVAGASAVYWTMGGAGLDFGGTPECVDTKSYGEVGGCVSATCGGGVAWGACQADAGGKTSACGGTGGSCGGGDGGGGCGGGCGGCGGCGG